jgi:hypothetical protein
MNIEFSIGIPEVILIFLMAGGLVYELVNHGKARTGRHDVYIKMLTLPITIGLLYWGGFF